MLDTTGKIGVFLRYRDVNYVDCAHPANTKPGPLRKAIMGSLRWGKPVVFDLRDVPGSLLTHLKECVAGCCPGFPDLWARLMDRSIKDPEHFMKLPKKAADAAAADNKKKADENDSGPDSAEYTEPSRWPMHRVAVQTVVLLTTALVVEDGLADDFLLFRVVDE